MRQGRKRGRDEHALTPARPQSTELWRERYEQAMHGGQRQDEASLALGALFAASHGTHHALTDLEALLGDQSPTSSAAGADTGSIDALRAVVARGIGEVCVAGAALGRALLSESLEPRTGPCAGAEPLEPDPGPSVRSEPLELARVVTDAHELLTRLVSSWHAVTDAERSLPEFGARLGGRLGELARLELRIRPSDGKR
jgi:hypothetical protein